MPGAILGAGDRGTSFLSSALQQLPCNEQALGMAGKPLLGWESWCGVRNVLLKEVAPGSN